MTLRPVPDQQSDEELIRQYRKEENADIVGILFKRYIQLVYGVCLKYLQDEDESKDAVMQIFEKLLTDLKKYDIGLFKPWLHTVTKNYCFQVLRSLKKEVSRIDPEVMEKQAYRNQHGDDQQATLQHERQLQQMEQVFEQLEPHQKQCLQLFYLQQKSYFEVSEITGFTMNQVKSYIQNGKRNLKIMMGKDEH